jgi:hypothetical protein
MQNKGEYGMGESNFEEKPPKIAARFRIATEIAAPQIREYILLAIGVLAISLLNISNYSIWKDDAERAFVATGLSFEDMMPSAMSGAAYLFFLRIWAGFAGTSEWALRASNLLFTPISLLYCLKILKAKNLSPKYSLVFFMHPMYVYYMDSVSPYAMIYALGFMFVYYVFCAEGFNRISNILKINAIYLLGVFVHFIFGFIYVIYLVRLASELVKKSLVLRNHLLMLLLFSLAYVPLLILIATNSYPVWTVSATATVKAIILIVYCFLGFFGLGLSRDDLQALNLDHISGVHILLCVLLALVLLLLVVYLIIYRVNPIANEGLLCAALAAYLVVFLIIAHIADFLLRERHVIPGLPLFLLIIVSGFDVLWKKAQPMDGERPPKDAVARARGLVAVALSVIALLLLSSANLRYSPYYRPVDARGALAYVRELLNDASRDRVIFTQMGNRVWTERYYGINAKDPGAANSFANYQYETPIYDGEVMVYPLGWETDTAVYKRLIDNKPPDLEYVFVIATYWESFESVFAFFDEQGFAKNTDYHLVNIYTVD